MNLFPLLMILSFVKDGVLISVLIAAGVLVVVDDVTAFILAVAVEVEVAVISDTAFGVTKVRNELDSRSTDGLGWMRTYNDDL
jgi:hypothetical protein